MAHPSTRSDADRHVRLWVGAGLGRAGRADPPRGRGQVCAGREALAWRDADDGDDAYRNPRGARRQDRRLDGAGERRAIPGVISPRPDAGRPGREPHRQRGAASTAWLTPSPPSRPARLNGRELPDPRATAPGAGSGARVLAEGLERLGVVRVPARQAAGGCRRYRPRPRGCAARRAGAARRCPGRGYRSRRPRSRSSMKSTVCSGVQAPAGFSARPLAVSPVKTKPGIRRCALSRPSG